MLHCDHGIFGRSRTLAKGKSGLIAIVFVVAAVGSWFVLNRAVFRKSELFYAGSLEATRIIIPSRLPSQIVEFDVKAGDRISKGSVVAKLDNADLLIALKKVKSKYDRALTLHKAGNFSKSDLETLQADKDDIELRLAWCNVRSPIDGVILAKYKERGEWVTQGTGLALIADIRNIKAFFYVEHDKIASLKIGKTIDCFLPEMQEHCFVGTVSVISSEPEFTPKNVQTRTERTRLVYKIQVDFDNEDEVLKPGMTIETLFRVHD
jgi:HlyD family secretion protein